MIKVMVLQHVMRRGVLVMLMTIALFALGLPLLAGGSVALAADADKSSSWLQVPKPRKGKGEKCVADTDFMRRNHMKMLMHQRDGTVQSGIRTKRFSLKECIACHAYTEPGAAKPVTVKSPKHFCRTCHDYAAVRVDCFQCHASRPVPGGTGSKPDKAAFHDGARKAGNLAQHQDAEALAKYVRSARR